MKLFCPASNWTWYITEYRLEKNLAFDYVMGFENEWGYVPIEEMDEVNRSWKLNPNGSSMTFVERDLNFSPTTFEKLKNSS